MDFLAITLQTGEVKDLIGIENVTIFGVLLVVIVGLVVHVKRVEAKHEKEKEFLRSEISKAHDKLDEEYRRGTAEVGKLAENYHVFTTQVFERLNTVINSL